MWFETCKSLQSDEFRKNVFNAIPMPAGSKRQEIPSRIVLDENGLSVKIHFDTPPVGEVRGPICKSTDVVPDFIDTTPQQPSGVERWIVRYSCRWPNIKPDAAHPDGLNNPSPETYRFTRKDPGEYGPYRYGGPLLVMETMRGSDWERAFKESERNRLDDAYKSPPP